MKKVCSPIFMILLASMMIILSCSSSNGNNNNQSPLAGEEAELEGNWWISALGDGVKFDGKGGGYDLSDDNYPDYCIDADDPLTYRFDGTTLNVNESGHNYTCKWTFIDDNTAELVLEGETLNAVRVTVTGNCD